MTRDELLIEVANDVKWLKTNIETNALANSAEHKEIITHLALLNGQTSKNKTSCAINTRAITGLGAVIVIIISILLHLMGVY